MKATYFTVTAFLATALATTVMAAGSSTTSSAPGAGNSNFNKGISGIGANSLNNPGALTNKNAGAQAAQAERKQDFFADLAKAKEALTKKLNEANAKLERMVRSADRKFQEVINYPSTYVENVRNDDSVKEGLADKKTRSLTKSAAGAALASTASALVSGTVPAVVAELTVAFATMAAPGNPVPKPSVDREPGEVGASKEVVAQIDGFMRNLKAAADAVLPPQDPNLAGFPQRRQDLDPKVGAEKAAIQKMCNVDIVGVCFGIFMEGASKRASDKFAADLAAKTIKEPRSGVKPDPSGNLPVVGPGDVKAPGLLPDGNAALRFLPHFYFASVLFNMLDAMAAGSNEVADFFRARLNTAGLRLVKALAVTSAEVSNAEEIERINRNFSVAEDKIAHLGPQGFEMEKGTTVKMTGVYQESAAILFQDVIPKSQAFAAKGVADWEKLKADEAKIAAQVAAQMDAVQKIKNDLEKPDPKFNEQPIADNIQPTQPNGGSSGGSGGGGGGSGGSSAGGGGGGKGVEAAQLGEPVKFTEQKFGSPGEGSAPVAAGPNAGRSADRGALPGFDFKVPGNVFAGNLPSSGSQPRPKALGLGSKRGNNSSPTGGSPGGLIGGDKGPTDPNGGPGGGGGGGAVAGKPGGDGGGGLGAVPEAKDSGADGGGDRGLTNNFVRTTDYGGGANGEGSVGAGPDSDNSDNMVAKNNNYIQNGKITGMLAEMREAKPEQVRGLGLMAHIGKFVSFCGESKNVSVTLCDAASRRPSSAGQAFRAPASQTVGEQVASRLTAGNGRAAVAPRALQTITR